jgi:hypothetical protein
MSFLGEQLNESPEPTAAKLSAFGGAGGFAAPRLRRGSVPGGCGSAFRSMKGIANLFWIGVLTSGLLTSGCGPSGKPTPDGYVSVREFEAIGQKSQAMMHTNSFYQMGLLEGRKHLKQRPTVSSMFFPAESTNWPESSAEFYRSGYVAGVSGK